MAFPTHSQWMAMTKDAIDNFTSDLPLSQPQAAKWQEHIDYRNNLISYAEDIIDAATNGIGSNPPTPPPQPPGV